jgi:hypothetical protein
MTMSSAPSIRLLAITSALIVGVVQPAGSQLPPYPPSAEQLSQAPKSYSDYYAEQLSRSHRPTANVYNYTIDRYFYHRPTLSPYLNLTRRTSPDNLNNYYRYVLPEVQRRAAAGSPPPRTTVATTPIPAPGPMPSPSTGHAPYQPFGPYFSQYYNFGNLPQKTIPEPLPKVLPKP